MNWLQYLFYILVAPIFFSCIGLIGNQPQEVEVVYTYKKCNTNPDFLAPSLIYEIKGKECIKPSYLVGLTHLNSTYTGLGKPVGEVMPILPNCETLVIDIPKAIRRKIALLVAQAHIVVVKKLQCKTDGESDQTFNTRKIEKVQLAEHYYKVIKKKLEDNPNYIPYEMDEVMIGLNATFPRTIGDTYQVPSLATHQRSLTTLYHSLLTKINKKKIPIKHLDKVLFVEDKKKENSMEVAKDGIIKIYNLKNWDKEVEHSHSRGRFLSVLYFKAMVDGNWQRAKRLLGNRINLETGLQFSDRRVKRWVFEEIPPLLKKGGNLFAINGVHFPLLIPALRKMGYIVEPYQPKIVKQEAIS